MHRASWPGADEVAATAGADAGVLRDVSVVLAGIRKAKSEAKTSMRTEATAATVTGPQEALDRVALAAADLQATGRVGDLALAADEGPLSVSVSLKPDGIRLLGRQRALTVRDAGRLTTRYAGRLALRHPCRLAVRHPRRLALRHSRRRTDRHPGALGRGATNATLQPSRSGLSTGWKAAALAAAGTVLIGLVLGGRFGVAAVRRRPGDAGHLDGPAQGGRVGRRRRGRRLP